MRTLLLIFGFTIAATAATIDQTERDFGKALSSNDMATLDKLLSADLSYTHSSGNTDSKAGYLESLKSGNQKYTAFDYDRLASKTYGDTALVFAEIHVKSITKGTPSESHLKVIHVWIKKGDTWQLVAHQSTKM